MLRHAAQSAPGQVRDPLDVKVFAGSSPGVGLRALVAFHKAVAEAGDAATLVAAGAPYIPCDVAVVYGMPKAGGGAARTEAPRRVRREIHALHHGPLIVIESGFIGRVVELRRRSGAEVLSRWLHGRFRGAYERINRDDHFRVAIGGAVHGEGDFCNAASPADRWQELARQRGLHLQPWRAAGRHVLVVGQVPGDAALNGLDIVAWIDATVRDLARHTDRPIVVRPHPMTDSADLRALGRLERDMPRVSMEIPPRGAVADSLEGAWATVCYSSGAAIDSLLAGIPAITMSEGSMAWPITGHELAQIEAPPMGPREQWLYDLCYAQWTAEEIRAGLVWRRFRPTIAARLAHPER